MRYLGRDNKYRKLGRLQRRFPRYWTMKIEAAVYQIEYPPLPASKIGVNPWLRR
jgi:hypothetical protein